MLAFSLPGMEISYDPLLTLLSLAIPIVVAAAAFVVVSQRPKALLVSGCRDGACDLRHALYRHGRDANGGLHPYDPGRVVLSIAIAISASIVALWLAFHTTSVIERVSAGAVMGLAISGMHYAAMQGSMFLPTDAACARPRRTRRGRSGAARAS